MEENQKIKPLSVARNFGLSNFALANRTSIVILMFLIGLMGLWAYSSMPKENFPEITIPTIYVGTPYPGNSPLDIENLITRPIEKEINTISGVTKITSNSVQDHSTIVVEFDFDVDITEALMDVKDAVDKAKSDLPSDLDTDPNVFEMDFAEIPVLYINVSGDDFSMDELKYYGEYLKDEIERLGEISKVDLIGALESEVRIEVDKHKMESLQISYNDIQDAIKFENSTISGGDILVDDFRRSIRMVGEFKDMEDIENVIVKSEYQNVVFLKDIADIKFTFEEPKSFARLAGSPVITLEVKKRSGENLLDATDKIKVIVKRAVKDKFPENLKVEFSNDTSRVTRLNVDNLENSIISGVILVVLVLLMFLGLRNAAFVGIAIPLSMLTGFIILNALGITMNMMVLFSLILALGMLVDNGIVVVENIYRLMQEGHKPLDAAKEGVGEVAWPIISSTATTLAAFFPLLLWNDIMGEFMKYLPMTLIIVLASSLFVALVINPVLTSLFMKVQEGYDSLTARRKKFRPYLITLGTLSVIFFGTAVAGYKNGILYGNIFGVIALIATLNLFVFIPASFWFQRTLLSRLERNYEKLLRFALRGYNTLYFMAGITFLLFFSIVFYFVKNPDILLFPDNVPNYVNVYIETPSGTDVQKTNGYTSKIENAIFRFLEKYEDDLIIESVLTNVGEGTSDPNSGEGAFAQGATPNKSKITVSFVEFQYRNGINTTKILEEMRSVVDTFTGVNITIDKEPVGPPVGPPISVEISGENFEELIEIANNARTYINNSDIEGIEELKIDLDIGKPELLIEIDRRAARRYGLSTRQIQSAIRTALFGTEVSKFKSGEDEYPIIVRLQDKYRYDLEALLNQIISFRDQASGNTFQVPISAVANVKYSATYAAVKRKDLDRVITLYSNVLEGYNANRIIEQLSEIFKDYKLPEGYKINFTGEVEEQQKSQEFLMRAFMIAVFLIFLIIVSQFNTLTSPIIIMSSVLFSTIGVFLAYALLDMQFIVIMTGIGIISLAGVVVNNAIVLIDYTNLVRERKRKELHLDNGKLALKDLIDVIVEGGKTRLRPVLLTAITTVLGLIPLAFGFNINFSTLMSRFDPQIFIGGDNVVFWQPMALTVIFGLIFATIVTLIIVPVMYLIFDRISNKIVS
ncbi:MAG: efflux RND transporter permease subunit [Chitinophagales bacterium]|nr:efflux RND transporter permease subunit [Chitinophagales bacterium]